ncbi:hypothetical protein ACH4E9_23970 [Streptomyces anulatus]
MTRAFFLGLAPVGCPDETVPVHREQTDHPLSRRVHIGDNGEVTITGHGKLYLNMSGDMKHTVEFRADGGQIVSYEVPRVVSRFHSRERASAEVILLE